jgi:putative transposase
LALDEPELSPRELAVRFTDTRRYFVSEASVYRLLKAHDLITSPAFAVISAADEFHEKTTRPNQLWQTDFTYLKVIGWGWFYLSTILDDYSRYIVAWRLCTTMRAGDVTATLEDALAVSGCDSATVAQRPRLLSPTMAHPTSPVISPAGSLRRAWTMSAAPRTIPRPKARSSAGTRP